MVWEWDGGICADEVVAVFGIQPTHQRGAEHLEGVDGRVLCSPGHGVFDQCLLPHTQSRAAESGMVSVPHPRLRHVHLLLDAADRDHG